MFLSGWIRSVTKMKWLVIVFWVLIAGIIFIKAPVLSQVAKTDQESFLPQNADVAKMSKMMKELYPGKGNGSSITIVLSRDKGINSGDRKYAKDIEAYLLKNKTKFKINSISSPFTNDELEGTMISKDKKAAIVRVDLSSAGYIDATNEIVRTIRANIQEKQGLNGIPSISEGLSVNITGDAALGQEQIDNVQNSMSLTSRITILLVVLILIIIYRSPVAPILPLVTIGLSFLISRGLIALTTSFGLKVSSFTETFLMAVLFGAGTDYCLLLISRYREEIVKGKLPKDALIDAFPNTCTAIVSSGGTVIIGFVFMFLAKFGLYNTTGPSIAIGVAITILAVITLTPSLIGIFGERIFWPAHPSKNIERELRKSGFWNKLSIAVTSRPMIFILACVLALTPFMISTRSLNRSFDQLGELPKKSDALKGFNIIKAHFDQGEMLPVKIAIKSEKSIWNSESLQVIDEIAGNILKVDGVAKVRTATRPLGEQLNEISIPNQIKMLSDGLHTVNQGFNPLLNGLDTMHGGISSISSNLSKGSSGLGILADKTMEVSEGINQIDNGLGDLSTGQGTVISVLEDVNKGMDDILGGMKQLKDGVDLASTSLQSVKTKLDDVIKQKPELLGDQNFQVAYIIIKGIVDRMPEMNTGVTKLNEGMQNVKKATDGSGEGLNKIRTGIDKSREALKKVIKGMETISQNQRKAGKNLRRASIYLDKIDSGIKPGKEGINKIKTGISRINDSASVYVNDSKKLGCIFYLPDGTLEKYPKLKEAMDYYIAPGGKGITFDVILSLPPYGEKALDSIDRIRDAVKFTLKNSVLEKAEFHIGGATASCNELRDITSSDFIKVMFFVLLGIFIVLVILLRSFIAPIYLIITILFSFASTMGITHLVFEKWIGKEGLSWSVPFFSFCILVALGVDYNIFLMTRVKEEYVPGDVKGGTARALESTGKIITSCGIIMAGTFGAMMASPITQLIEIGFATVVGLLLDTFIIRCLLVPAIAVKTGELNWWPGRRVRVVPVVNKAPGEIDTGVNSNI